MYCLSIFDNVKYNLNFLVPMKKCKECKRPITNPRNSLQLLMERGNAQGWAKHKLKLKVGAMLSFKSELNAI
jgi:hypothetical protein